MRRGAEQLRALTEAPTMTDLAEALGVTRQAVSAWARGEAVPSPALRPRIEEILGIPVEDWLSDEEREMITARRGGA